MIVGEQCQGVVVEALLGVVDERATAPGLGYGPVDCPAAFRKVVARERRWT